MPTCEGATIWQLRWCGPRAMAMRALQQVSNMSNAWELPCLQLGVACAHASSASAMHGATNALTRLNSMPPYAPLHFHDPCVTQCLACPAWLAASTQTRHNYHCCAFLMSHACVACACLRRVPELCSMHTLPLLSCRIYLHRTQAGPERALLAESEKQPDMGATAPGHGRSHRQGLRQLIMRAEQARVRADKGAGGRWR